jgi:GABA(A) receptor-associated protein
MRYKERHTLNERKSESARIKDRYNGLVPVIIESKNMVLTKKKYLVPNHLTIGQFVFFVRKQLSIRPEKAIFLYINGRLPPTSESVLTIQTSEMDEDGFLYMEIEEENTFG